MGSKGQRGSLGHVTGWGEGGGKGVHVMQFRDEGC